MSWRRIAAAWAGPLLIVGLVLLALRGFAFQDRLTNEHPDLLAFWLPRWTFLGTSLAHWHLPAWNPFEMAGYRFAADPQSGWLYLPPMALFSTLSPGAAIRAMIVLQPLLAGLGLYGFLRVESMSRLAAAVGGISLSGAMGASEIAISLPFAGTLAWTPVLLLAAAGFLRAGRWSRRLLWIALGGLTWSQVASAHMSHGLAIASALVAAYLVAASAAERWKALGRTALFALALPLLSLAVLTPRLAFIGESSLGSGYEALATASADEGEPRPGGAPEDPSEEGGLQAGGVWAGWPLASSAAPGAYAGAAALLAVPMAIRSWRRRPVVKAFLSVGGATWLLLLLAGAGWFRTAMLALPGGDVLLHNPGRLRYALVLVLPVLASAGVQGLLDDPPTLGRGAVWLGAGALLWIGLPLAMGGEPARWQLFGAAALPAAAGLLLVALRPDWGPAAAAVLAVELAVASLLASGWKGDDMLTGLEGGRTPLAFQPLRAPDVDLAAYLRPTDLVLRIGDDRYMTWAPPAAAYEKGYLFAQEPVDWPALANERGTLFQIRDALGYNPVQLPRYWAWIRAVNPLPLYYNAAVLARPRPVDLQLLGVRYLVVPQDVLPTVPGHVVDTADGYDLFEFEGAQPMASVVPDWTPVSGLEHALPSVRWEGFTPQYLAAVEGSPGIQRIQGAPAGEASYRELWPERAVVEVTAEAPSIVLIRTSYEEGWSATVDGEPARTLPTDAFLIGVPVQAGRHTVELTYTDRDIARGLALGAAAWTAWALALVSCLTLERRRRASSARPR